MEFEAAGRKERGEGDEVSQVTVPVLFQVAGRQCGERPVGREVARGRGAALLLAGD